MPVFSPTKGMTEVKTHYCPGCTHGIIHRLVAEVLEEKNLLNRACGMAPVGCAVLADNYFNCDMFEAAHGRAPAVATGVKRVRPENFVFTYQGDGDLASIGMAEIVHAAHRGELISVIFVNNAIYGMTGGQMAPTTLIGQKTTTSPYGRQEILAGKPIRVSEMLATIDGAKFVERVTVTSPGQVRKAKKAIETCFQVQEDKLGFGMVEVLSTCPTNWGFGPKEAMKWLEDNMIPYYPLGNFRNPYKEA